MTILEQIYYVAELLGVTAVVVSLVYVAVQVKQGAQVVRLNAAHSIAESWRDTASLIAGSADLAELLTKGFRDPESLLGPEKLRFNAYLQNLFKIFENAFYHQRQDALDEQFWIGMKEWFVGVTDMPGAKAYWEQLRYIYSEDFQRFMDEQVVPTADQHGYRVPGT